MMGNVGEVFTMWLRYAGFQKPKISLDKYRKAVEKLTPSEQIELNKKIQQRQKSHRKVTARRIRRR